MVSPVGVSVHHGLTKRNETKRNCSLDFSCLPLAKQNGILCQVSFKLSFVLHLLSSCDGIVQ